MRIPGGVEISVIIPVYNPEDIFFRLLEELVAQDLEVPYEIVIVDDCSPGEGFSRIKKHLEALGQAKIKLLRTPRNSGPAAARNLGIQRSQGNVLVLIDADCLVLQRRHLARLYRAHLEHPEAIIGGGVAGSGRGYAAFADNYCHWGTNIPGTPPQALTSGHLVTAHMLIPKSIWKKVGPFDPSLRTGEDTAFCLKSRRQGIELRLHGDIILGHQDRETWRDFLKSFYKVGKDRAAVRRSVYGEVPWFLAGSACRRGFLAPVIAGGLVAHLLIRWWPYDKRVLLAVPGLWAGMLAMALGVASGEDKTH
ncbi:MAG: glycosyltransferase family A protein [Thermodesulfobacteriota bacterium]